MILKRRSDEADVAIRRLERVNEELDSSKQQAAEEMTTERKRFNLLDGRFNTLASNHQEMIQVRFETEQAGAA